MRAILVLMDSLNRHFLPAYGNDWVIAPNITRFCRRSVRFDRHHLGSAPCMPARRDMLTGRLNFLERGWGGVEPFDRCYPQTLSDHGVFTHLVTDHYHYASVGGENYLSLYDSWELIRGQENDPWVSRVEPLPERPHLGRWSAAYAANSTRLTAEEAYATPRTFQSAIQWVRTNGRAEDWFLMVEAFDPHEPFDVPQGYLDLYGDDWDGPQFTWPEVKPLDLSPEALRHIRRQYAACLTMTDRWFGRLLDELEAQGCLQDTLIILTTDHGHMLGEHGLMVKNYQPVYDELALIPLMVHLPGDAHAGEVRSQLTQNIDLAPTLLEYFGLGWEHPIHGASLWPLLADPAAPGRPWALYGWFGRNVNISDGRFTYLRAANADNAPLYQHGCMASTHGRYWPREAFAEIEAGRYLPYTDMPVFRLPVHQPTTPLLAQSHLYDREVDPAQEVDLVGTAAEPPMRALLERALREVGAPPEQFQRLGLGVPMDDATTPTEGGC
ncbi:MAG: sulfatase [Anaerolineae bacterium]|jgi:arylsulfatase A-like enzyme|nr:sulfatase [Chloroflexota bacterium]